MNSKMILYQCLLVIVFAGNLCAAKVSTPVNNDQAVLQSSKNITLTASTQNFWDIPLQDIEGKVIPLNDYQNKVVLLVNTASKCGYTNQLKELQTLHEQYQSRGLVILGVPSNDFMSQEPLLEKEIKSFYAQHYQVSFPLLRKSHVIGSNMHPLYVLLQKNINSYWAQPVSWNFEKYLFNVRGEVVGRYPASIPPTDPNFIKVLEKELGQIPEMSKQANSKAIQVSKAAKKIIRQK